MRLRNLLREIVLAVLFFLGSCFVSLDGQVMLEDTTPVMGITPPPVADSAYRYDIQCAHLNPDSVPPLSAVHWWVAPLIEHSVHHSLLGMWIQPNAIILDLRFANNFTVVAHELMHFVRQSVEHPADPFDRCQLGE